ncbi:MAG: protein kinase [Planctomycetaceae bacterium]
MANLNDEERLDELFEKACELPKADRAKLLQNLPERDREYIEGLLKAFDGVGDGFLEPVASEVAPDTAQPIDTKLDASAPYQTNVAAKEGGATNVAGGRFRVLRKHAEGGLGEVFLAHDTVLNREVALKEIRVAESQSDVNRTRFRNEAEVTGRLEHPGIVPVYDLGHHEDGRPFYAMRFIRGGDLKSAIKKFHNSPSSASSRNLEFRELLGRFVDVCNAVSYAHSRGVLHRDLKPNNIMLGEYGETLVVDWGIARTGNMDLEGLNTSAKAKQITPAHPHDTSAGTVLGTIEYMSPEQASANTAEIGPPSDTYSLGAILYEILTGHAPIPSEDADGRRLTWLAMLNRVREGEFDKPTVLKPSTPKALEAVCLHAMRKAPSERYADPKLLADDIEKWLADEPVSVHSEATSTKLKRWVRKHNGLVSGLVGALMVTAAGTTVASIGFNRLRNDADFARATAEAANLKLDVNGKSQKRVANQFMAMILGRSGEERPEILRQYRSILAAELQRNAAPSIRLQFAETLVELEEYEDAIAMLKPLLKAAAPYLLAETNRQLMYAYRGQANFKEAVVHAEAAIQYGGRTQSNLYELFKCYLSANEVEDAEHIYTLLEEQKANLAREALGDSLLKAGNYTKANALFEKVELQHGSESVHREHDADLLVKVATTRLGINRLRDAVEAASQARDTANGAYESYYLCHLEQCLLIAGELDRLATLNSSLPEKDKGSAFEALHLTFQALGQRAVTPDDIPRVRRPSWLKSWNYDFLDAWAARKPEEERAGPISILNRMKRALPNATLTQE